MDSSRVELISKKFVKPQFPTPPSLRNYKLCLMDQLMTPSYIPIAFFYPNQHHNHPADSDSCILEESLSKTLASYYPFAGTLTDNISISCNDIGATFMQVRIRCPMSEILEEENVNGLQGLIFPNGLAWSSSPDDDDQLTLVVAQLSRFDCGGIALSVCMTHKIGDARTLCYFIHDWAAMARDQSSDNHKLAPQLSTAANILLPKHAIVDKAGELKQGQHYITKRYAFDNEKISELKAKATAESGVQNPTRVEVVSALLYKCAMSASMAYSGSFKSSALAIIVNLRPLIGLPATPNYVGNLVSNFPVSSTNEMEVKFSRLVSKIRRKKLWFYEKFKKIKTDDLLKVTLETAQEIAKLHGKKNDIDGYTCTSFCTFPTYHIDFGWGRPIRVIPGDCPKKNFFLLMDNYNMDGVEAFVTLEDQVMSVFQNDPHLLAFASSSSF